MTCEDTPRRTGSPGLEDGRSPSDEPDGPTTDPCGPEAVPVSRFRARDSGKAMPTNDTSGPLFTNSSPSAALQRSLESRLRDAWDTNGSLEYALTWKAVDMPSGPPIFRLRARARRISDSGYSGWPSPKASNATGVGTRGAGGENLQTAAEMAGWPTPTKGNADGSQMAKDASATGRRPDGSKATVSLPQVASMAGWTTPQAHDTHPRGAGNRQNPKGGGACLAWDAKLAGWNQAGGALPADAAKVSGLPTISSTAETTRRVALSPEHSRWLMSFPAEWATYAPGREDWLKWQSLMVEVWGEPRNIVSARYVDTGTRS